MTAPAKTEVALDSLQAGGALASLRAGAALEDLHTAEAALVRAEEGVGLARARTEESLARSKTKVTLVRMEVSLARAAGEVALAAGPCRAGAEEGLARALDGADSTKDCWTPSQVRTGLARALARVTGMSLTKTRTGRSLGLVASRASLAPAGHGAAAAATGMAEETSTSLTRA